MHHSHKLRSAAVFVFLFAIAHTGHAQNSWYGGSSYDNIGFGLPVRSGNAVSDALGGTGVALDGSRIVNDMNPADWTWITRARFGVSLMYNYVNSTQGTLQDLQQNFQISGGYFAAPIYDPLNATIALGYVPLTDANNEAVLNDSLGSKTYNSRGGTNMVFAGIAARPIPAIALGARLDFITGDIRHMDLVVFNDSDAGNGTFEQDYLFYGARPTFGIEIIGDSIADALDGLTIGASYSLATKLNSTQEQIITPTTSTLDTTLDAAGVGQYPAELSAGISFHLSRRYRAEADYFAQNFSTAYLYSPTAISGDSQLRASNRFAFGIERLPNVNSEFGTSFGLDRWALRLGFSYGTLPVAPVGSGGVRQYALSAGVGIPISLETMLDLSLVAGQNVPITGADAPKDTFIRLGVDVSFAETWFVPTRKQ